MINRFIKGFLGVMIVAVVVVLVGEYVLSEGYLPITDASELKYLSGDLLGPKAWNDYVWKLKMCRWKCGMEGYAATEFACNYSRYYTLIHFSVGLLCMLMMVMSNVWGKCLRRASIVTYVGLATLLISSLIVFGLWQLPRPSVLSQIEYEWQFLSHQLSEDRVPYRMGDGVCLHDSPTYKMGRAIPKLEENYVGYVKRWLRPIGMHGQPIKGRDNVQCGGDFIGEKHERE